MSLFTSEERRLADAVREIATVNPFRPRRVEIERGALGSAYVEVGTAKALDPSAGPNPNSGALLARVRAALAAGRARAAESPRRPSARDRRAAGDLALYSLYIGHRDRLEELAQAAQPDAAEPRVDVPWYREFKEAVETELRFGAERLRPEEDAPQLLALYFQIARAFVNVYASFAGRSAPAIELRAAMWESVFTHDLLRYRRALMGTGARGVMADVPTLITGPSGTGKELVARAIGRSAYVPFDPKRRAFRLAEERQFLPIHLAALSPSLIESELFGHRRGAFTGALENRSSFLERCAPYGAVFLDEIAEIDGALQVKLLRVLQTREFTRLGETETRRFEGRLVSATNRDLAAEISAGRFREDLYFRINADRIETPRLAELIGGDSAELEYLAGFVARRLLARGEPADGDAAGGDPADEARAFGAELCEWIEANLGLSYGWPGNFRELEQSARAVLLRGRYHPQRGRGAAPGAAADLGERVRAGELTADELLTGYCAQVYREAGSYDGAARRLGLDRRTVRARVAKARNEETGRVD